MDKKHPGGVFPLKKNKSVFPDLSCSSLSSIHPTLHTARETVPKGRADHDSRTPVIYDLMPKVLSKVLSALWNLILTSWRPPFILALLLSPHTLNGPPARNGFAF